MKPLVKVLVSLLVVLVALLVIAAIAFKIMVDPDNLKARVTSLVKEQTGRDLRIDGELNLTFFPWLGFDIGNAALSNAPNFTDEDMLTFSHANASVRLWPLVSKRIEVGTLNLSGLTISLEKKADGSTNWDDLLAAFDSGDPEATQEPSDDAGFSPTGLGGVEITDAKVRWRDAEAGSDYQITNLDFTTGTIAAGEAVPVDLSFDALSESPKVTFSATLNTTFLPEAANSYLFEATEITMTGQGETLPGDTMSLSVKGSGGAWKGEEAKLTKPQIILTATNDASLGDVSFSIDADQLVQKVQSSILRFDGPKARLSASKLGADLDIKAVNIASRLTTQSFQVVKLDASGSLDLTGSGPGPVKLTADEFIAVLSKQTLNIKNAKADVLGMQIQTSLQGTQILDKPRVSGPLEISNFSPRSVMGALGQEVPVTADPQVLKNASLKTTLGMGENNAALRDIKMTLDDTTITGSIVVRDMAKSIYDVNLNVDKINADRYLPPPVEEETVAATEPVVIPKEPLQNKTLNGKLKIGELIMSGLKTTNIDAGINIRNQQFRLYPAKANFYGGTYSGDIKLNVSGAKPTLSMNENVANIQLGPLSKDMIDDERMLGTAKGSVVLTAVGADLEEMKKTISGKIGFQVTDGAVNGMNLWYELQRAFASAQASSHPRKKRPIRPNLRIFTATPLSKTGY